MRNLKKVLALVIAFSMMLSVVAFAGYNDVEADADYAGAVELLSALDIIKGDDQGNFNPDNTITRAEMAAIICRAKGLEDAATGAMGPTAFTDVAADHWAAGYVNLASQNGIINGYGDGKFGPEDTVTYEQAIKMIVCALGFEPMAAAKGGWPTGYLVVANGYKMTAGASVNATRANIAIIVANAMNTPMMDQTSFGTDAKFEVLDDEDNYRTLLTDMDIYVATGIVGAKEADEVEFTVKEDSDDFKFKASNTAKSFKIGDTNIAEYKNQMVDAYVLETGRNKFEVVAVAPAALSETLVLIYDVNEVEVITDDGKEVAVKYFPAGSSKAKEIDIDLDTIEFNKDTNYSDLATVLAKGDDVELTFINNDDDSEFDALVAVQYTSTRVDYVEAEKNKIGFNNRIATLDFEDEDKTIILRDADGKDLTLDDFAEDDVIAVVMDASSASQANYIEIIKLTDATVTGAVETTWKDGDIDYVSIDGKDYVNAGDALEPGDEGTFYIGMTGKIIDFEGVKTAGNYGFILEAAKTVEFSKAKWQVRMLTAADGVVVFDVDEDLTTIPDGKAFKDTDLGAVLTAISTWDAKDEVVTYKRNDVAKRLVEYEVDSKGNIDEIAVCAADAIGGLTEYNGDTQRIAGKTLADDITVMYINKANAEDVYTTDINFLVDEASYDGYIYKDAEKKENVVMIVTATDSPFRAENGFAIVTRVSTAKDAEGNAVTKVNYVQGETEGVVTFDKDAEKAAYTDDYDDLTLGSMFLFNADEDGVVTAYAVIGQYADTDKSDKVAMNFVLDKDVAADYAADKYGEDYEIGTGYLYHSTKKAAYIATTATVDGADDVAEFTIGAAFKYTFNDAVASRAKIEIGDYLATAGTEFWSTADDNAKKQATPVVYVAIDGELVDIFTANTKVDVTFAAIDSIID